MSIFYKDADGELIEADVLPEGATQLKGKKLDTAIQEVSDQIALEQKKDEVAEFISSRYSQSDQLNMTGKVLYEIAINGAPTEATMQEAVAMYNFISGVLAEFHTKGADADLTQFE